mmetsp:Transcript_71645/g.160734  ORF Transcript_71645/g.160734 Transcript_71645/m.160734 type:complete len:318 (+) Transcript_71645:765-1718(+)
MLRRRFRWVSRLPLLFCDHSSKRRLERVCCHQTSSANQHWSTSVEPGSRADTAPPSILFAAARRFAPRATTRDTSQSARRSLLALSTASTHAAKHFGTSTHSQSSETPCHLEKRRSARPRSWASTTRTSSRAATSPEGERPLPRRPLRRKHASQRCRSASTRRRRHSCNACLARRARSRQSRSGEHASEAVSAADPDKPSDLGTILRLSLAASTLARFSVAKAAWLTSKRRCVMAWRCQQWTLPRSGCSNGSKAAWIFSIRATMRSPVLAAESKRQERRTRMAVPALFHITSVSPTRIAASRKTANESNARQERKAP